MPQFRIIIAWVFFVLGIAAILFGGYGLLTHSHWSDTVNSLCTIFGTMMSFAQLFIAFPTPLKLTGNKVAPASPAASMHRSSASPPYPHPPQPYQPYPFQNQGMVTPFAFPPVLSIDERKMYRRSAIALLLAAPCVFIEALGDFSISTFLGLLVVIIFAIPEDIFFLVAIRGLHAKQAQQARWINIPSIVLFATAYIVQIVAHILILVFVLNFQYLQNDVKSITFLVALDAFFIVAAQLLLGLAILRAGVYPRWTGTTLITLGIVNAIFSLIALLAPTQNPEAYILENFVIGVLDLVLGVLYIRWAIVLFK